MTSNTAAEPLWLGTTDRYARLRQIEKLDLEKDFREITLLFYGDFQSVILPVGFNGFAFTYAAPTISKVLSATGEVEHRLTKRIVDTTLLARQVMQHGLREPEGRDAARRVNAMHKHYDIRTKDFVATGAENALGSVELAEKCGWRPVTDKEREAVRLYYSQQTRAFGSPEGLPPSVAETKAFFDDYLNTEVRYAPENERLTRVLLNWYGNLVPRPWGPLFKAMLVAQLEPRIARACGLKPLPAPARWAAHAFLRAVGRKDPVPDGQPSAFEARVRTVYPNGWSVETIGTHVTAETAAAPADSVAL